MKARLKKVLLILLMIVAAVPCLAQQRSTISFSYDENGNRTTRGLALKRVSDDGMNVMVADSPLDKANVTFSTMNVNIYPNPTTDKVNIAMTNTSTNSPLRVIIVNANGAVLFDGIMNSLNETVDVKDFSSGVYFLRLVLNDESHTWAIIKE